MARRDWLKAYFRLRRAAIKDLRRDVRANLTLMGRNAVLELETGARDAATLIPAQAGDDLGRVVVSRLEPLSDDLVAAAVDSYAALPDAVTIDASDIFDRAGQRMVDVTDRLRNRVGEIVADGVTRDLPLSDIADGIQELVDSPSRALTVARTEVATAGNETVARAWTAAGVEDVTISDGLNCGWRSHGDSLKADGLVRAVAEFERRPIAHPNCQRTAYPLVNSPMEIVNRPD